MRSSITSPCVHSTADSSWRLWMSETNRCGWDPSTSAGSNSTGIPSRSARGWTVWTHRVYSDDPILAVFRFLDLTFIIQVVLSLFAIVLTYDSISGEREQGTLRLTFANAVPRGVYLVAKLIGTWLGAQLAAWLLPGVGQTLAQLYGVYISYPDGLVPNGFWLPMLMTIIAAVLCVLFPLREALNAPMLERRQTGWQLRAVVRRDLVMSATGLLLLAAAVALGFFAESLWTALVGMACLLLGAALFLPLVLRVLIAGLERLVPPKRARLSWLLADSRWLLGPASLALMAMTLALVANSGLNTMIHSFRAATDDWLSQRLVADLYLRGQQELNGLEQWLAVEMPELKVAKRFKKVRRMDRYQALVEESLR